MANDVKLQLTSIDTKFPKRYTGSNSGSYVRLRWAEAHDGEDLPGREEGLRHRPVARGELQRGAHVFDGVGNDDHAAIDALARGRQEDGVGGRRRQAYSVEEGAVRASQEAQDRMVSNLVKPDFNSF